MERGLICMTVSKLNNDIEQRAAEERKFDERARLIALEEYRKQAQQQWFEEGTCTGGPTPGTDNKVC